MLEFHGLVKNVHPTNGPITNGLDTIRSSPSTKTQRAYLFLI